jgi:hypothetical protein
MQPMNGSDNHGSVTVASSFILFYAHSFLHRNLHYDLSKKEVSLYSEFSTQLSREAIMRFM